MAPDIIIKLDGTQYRIPTDEDVKNGKDFVLRRNEYAITLSNRIDDVLDEMIERIVTICYRYGIDPKTFTISDVYNPDMMQEISDVMDEIKEEMISLIGEYSTGVTTDKDRMALLLAWMLSLGTRNRNFTETLEGYLLKTLHDLEAALAAMAAKKMEMAEMITTLKLYKHQIYTIPMVLEAFRHTEDFSARYILSLGVQEGAVGLSNNGSTNVVNMAKTTLQMVWMRSHRMDYEESGAVGYYVLRGSLFPCPNICEPQVGFHRIDDKDGFPPYHPRCSCWTIPVYPVD